MREVVTECWWNNYRLVLNWIERVEERVVLWKGRYNLKENVFFKANGTTYKNEIKIWTKKFQFNQL